MSQQDLFAQVDEKPIVIAVDAQEIGALHAAKTNPDEFNQFLLQKFKAAGAPVEWSPRGLKFAHGEMARFRKEKQPGVFHYAWLPTDYAVTVREAQKSGGYV